MAGRKQKINDGAVVPSPRDADGTRKAIRQTGFSFVLAEPCLSFLCALGAL